MQLRDRRRWCIHHFNKKKNATLKKKYLPLRIIRTSEEPCNGAVKGTTKAAARAEVCRDPYVLPLAASHLLWLIIYDVVYRQNSSAIFKLRRTRKLTCRQITWFNVTTGRCNVTSDLYLACQFTAASPESNKRYFTPILMKWRGNH